MKKSKDLFLYLFTMLLFSVFSFSSVPSVFSGSWENVKSVKTNVLKGEYKYYPIYLNKGDQVKFTVQSSWGAKFDAFIIDDNELYIYEDCYDGVHLDFKNYLTSKFNTDNVALDWTAEYPDTYYLLVDNSDIPLAGVGPKGDIDITIQPSVLRSGYIEPLNSPAKIAYKGIRFFERGKDAVNLQDRKYTSGFPKSTTRRICYEIEVDNLLYGKYNDTSKLHAKYYKPDKTILNEFDGEIPLNSEDKAYYHAEGLGWDDPGKWEIGTYSVLIYADGNYLCEDFFTIYDDR